MRMTEFEKGCNHQYKTHTAEERGVGVQSFNISAPDWKVISYIREGPNVCRKEVPIFLAKALVLQLGSAAIQSQARVPFERSVLQGPGQTIQSQASHVEQVAGQIRYDNKRYNSLVSRQIQNLEIVEAKSGFWSLSKDRATTPGTRIPKKSSMPMKYSLGVSDMALSRSRHSELKRLPKPVQFTPELMGGKLIVKHRLGVTDALLRSARRRPLTLGAVAEAVSGAERLPSWEGNPVWDGQSGNRPR